MRRIKSTLVLLLAFTMFAVFVSSPAAHAVSTNGSSGGLLNGGVVPSTTSTTGTSGSGQGDPGGAGDGLGADLTNGAAGSGQSLGSVAADLVLQLLRLLQTAG